MKNRSVHVVTSIITENWQTNTYKRDPQTGKIVLGKEEPITYEQVQGGNTEWTNIKTTGSQHNVFLTCWLIMDMVEVILQHGFTSESYQGI